MGEQHLDVALGRAHERGERVRGVARHAMARTGVGHPGEQQPAAAPLQQPVSVGEDAEPQPLDLSQPPRGVPVVLVVPADEELAVAGAQLGERSDRVAQRRHRSVRHVAGEGHDVGIEAVRRVHDRLHEATLDGRADVEVAELDDAESVQIGWESRDRHRDAHHPRSPRQPGACRRQQRRPGQDPERHQARVHAPHAHREHVRR